MASSRVISHESQEILALHLRRLGLAGDRLAAQLGSCGWQVLLTGLEERSLAALKDNAGGLQLAFGEPERARGTVLISGRRDQLDELRARRDEGLGEVARLIAQAVDGHGRPPAPMLIGKRRFVWGERTFLMGVVNVTPDSFSDGGKHYTTDTAVAAGERLAAEGVDLIDIGGESTRPGAAPVDAAEERRRVEPVVRQLVRQSGLPVSIDTTKAEVAAAALDAGAEIVNDISGLTFDPEMAPTCARLGLSVCAMHIRGTPRNMQEAPSYLDLMGEIIEGLSGSLAVAARGGLAPERIVVDPGLGFGKTAEHNLFILRNLGQLKALGRPLLVGASRKSFIGKVTGRAVGERLPGSLAVLTAAVLGGADLVRVHDVAESRVAAQVVDAIARARDGGVAFIER